MRNSRLFDDGRFRLLCQRIHAPGPRFFGELLSEFADEIGRERLMERMEVYATAAIVGMKLGAGDMPARPIIDVPKIRGDEE